MTPRFGAISFTRHHVIAAYADADWLPAGLKHDGRGMPAMELEKGLKKFLDQLDHPEGVLKIDLEQMRPLRALREAVRFIEKSRGNRTGIVLRRVVTAGYGPFLYSANGQSLSKVSDKGDLPFRNINIRGAVAKGLEGIRPAVEIDVTTDVAAMAIAAYWHEWLDSRDLAFSKPNVPAAFIVERGIGGAVAQRFGQVQQQAHHSEMGQIPVRRHEKDRETLARDCLETRAGAKAIETHARNADPKISLKELLRTPDHSIWDIEAYYLTQMCEMICLVAAPTRIVIGGETIEQAPWLIDSIRMSLPSALKVRIDYDALHDIESFIQPVDRKRAMITGALLQALQPERLLQTQRFG